MTKKLFRVKITYDTMIVVEEDKLCPAVYSAYRMANEELSVIVTGDDEPEIDVREEITSVDQLGPEWDGAIPYGCADGMTCNEILGQLKKEEVIEKLTDDQKKEILSKMTLEEIVTLLNKND